MRKRGRTDGNHAEIVDALLRAGCGVISLANLGGGIPDLLVYSPYSKTLWLLEVKDGSKPPSKRTLTLDQIEWHKKWPGKVHIVHNAEDALWTVWATRRWEVE